ncbi:sulfite exporter TauE/SafE family protein [Bacillus salitolerans]|uniref:Probable membrane transporter protein n=1 Tax=Bacillus salitolerans TaxID=1437434 RepID=A0ABW4LQG7_9BACI
MTEVQFFLIGFAGTFIGTLAGGGGLISMPSLLMLGIPIHTVIATNKFSNTFSSFSSFYVLLKQKQINLKTVLVLSPIGLAGGITGSFITKSISESLMTIIALFLLFFALIISFLKKPKEEMTMNTKLPVRMHPIIFGIGVYDGMFGPGQATLQMYTYLNHGFSFMKAMALTRFLTFLSCLGAAASYFVSGLIDWKLAIFLTTGSILGAQLSVRFAYKLKNTHLKIILRVITVLLILQLGYSILV